jgi:tetratricopeptide (TPR) repeat protein
VDHLLTRSRCLQEIGRLSEALDLLKRVSALGGQSTQPVAEIQMQMAQLYISSKRFVRARQVLRLALKHRPDNARLHFLQATAYSSGKKSDPVKALAHFHRSLELEPKQPACLAKCGLFEIRQRKNKAGLAHCRQAWELASDDVEIIKQVIRGYRLAGQPDEGRKILLAARFRNPRVAKIQHLWNQFQFLETRRIQQAPETRSAQSMEVDESVILSFAAGVSAKEIALNTQRTCRQDKPEELSPPKTLLRLRKPGQRHAQ